MSSSLLTQKYPFIHDTVFVPGPVRGCFGQGWYGAHILGEGVKPK